jgi:hypothetical protein
MESLTVTVSMVAGTQVQASPDALQPMPQQYPTFSPL